METILFVASKPLDIKKICKTLSVSESGVLEAMQILKDKYNHEDSGIMIIENNHEWQMVSHPDNYEMAEVFLKAEVSGELTRPQLETLTVISYRGPITKPELDQIRGVNCSLILRNLMVRGLIKENSEHNDLLPTYEVTVDYLRHLGISNPKELPDFELLSKSEVLDSVLKEGEKEN